MDYTDSGVKPRTFTVPQAVAGAIVVLVLGTWLGVASQSGSDNRAFQAGLVTPGTAAPTVAGLQSQDQSRLVWPDSINNDFYTVTCYGPGSSEIVKPGDTLAKMVQRHVVISQTDPTHSASLVDAIAVVAQANGIKDRNKIEADGKTRISFPSYCETDVY